MRKPYGQEGVQHRKEVNTMNRVWVYLSAMLIGLSLTTLVFGGQPGYSPEPGKSLAPVEKSEASKEAMGEVVNVDPARLSLVIKTGGKELTFRVAEQAAKALVTLKPGDKVMLQYTEAHGMRTVQEIRKG